MTRRYTGGFLSAKEQATDSNTANGIFTLSEAEQLTATGNFPVGRFTPQRSLRFRKSATARLNKTFGVAPTSRTTHTMSVWVKRGLLSGGSTQCLFGTDNNYENCSFFTDDTIRFTGPYMSGTQGIYITNSVYRDISAWYHLVFVYDTTNVIATERMRLYVNGVKVTSYSTQTTPAQNATTTEWLNSGFGSGIGTSGGSGSGSIFDGYMAEVNVIDGQALDASYFGATDPETGTWVPKQYTGTYGTNGFYLPFSDNTSLNNIGFDKSALSPELITNGLFPSNVSGWTVSPSVGGSPSITWVSGAARITNSSNNGVYYYQAIPTTIGNTYYVRGYVSNISIGGSARLCKIQKSDDTSNSVNRVDIGSVAQSSGSGWISGTFTATATTSYIQLNADIIGTGNQGADFDNISVSETGYKNHWNANNISISGATNDSMVDVPGIANPIVLNGSIDPGGATRGNYCTLNSTIRQYSSTDSTGSSQPSEQWADANLRVFYKNDGVSGSVYGTMPIPNTGKWYFEYTDVYESANAPVRYGQWVGIAPIDRLEVQNGTYAGGAYDIGYVYTSEGGLNQSYSATGIANQAVDTYANYGTGDIIGIAYDADARTISWYKNNTLITTVKNIYYQPGGYVPCAGGIKQNTGSGWNTSNIPAQGLFNFGATPFSYNPPAGYKTLCTTNLPAPAIKRPSDQFDVKLYNGNGTGQIIGNTTARQTSTTRISNSARFRSANPNVLSRNLTTSGNSQKFTWSGWVKHGSNSGSGMFMSAGDSSNRSIFGTYGSSNQFTFLTYTGYSLNFTTTQSFRSVAKWQHFVFAVDTTQASPAAGVKLWVDGVLQTKWDTMAYSQNYNTYFNDATHTHYIGQNADGNQVFTGYMAEVNWIDGQQVDVSNFGQFDANNNWVPKTYTGTYGTNGFYLPFNDASSVNGGKNIVSVSYGPGLGAQTTVNTTVAIPNNTVVDEIGFYSQSSESGKYNYIVRSDGAGVYTVVATTASYQHYGQGLQYVPLTSQYTIPSTGTYYMAVYCPGSGLNWGHDLAAPSTSITYYAGAASGSQTYTTANTSYRAAALVYRSNTGIGYDASGNKNTWDASGFLVTAGIENDITVDSPTDYDPGTGDIGGSIRGNMCTLDVQYMPTASPAGTGYTMTYYNNSNASSAYPLIGTHVIQPNTGKYYWEVYLTGGIMNGTYPAYGMMKKIITGNIPGDNTTVGGFSFRGTGNTYTEGNAGSSFTSPTTNDIMGIAYDSYTGKWWVSKNGTWYNSGNPTAGTGYLGIVGDRTDLVPGFISYNNYNFHVNFGHRPFNTAPPAGFRSLNSKSLKDFGAYNLPDNFGNVVNTPDLVWIKNRTGANNHVIANSVTGIGLDHSSSTSTGALYNEGATGVQGFLPNGFALGADNSGIGSSNANGSSYASWLWNRGVTPGFDIVTYAGNGASGNQIAHGLGTQPAFIIARSITGATGRDWFVWHKGLPYGQQLRLDSTAVAETVSSATTAGGLGTPTATAFTFISGSTNTDNVNASGVSYIAYLWSEVPGFSKFGIYNTNGSTDGPVINCGFKPRFILIKTGNTFASAWHLIDTARDKYNPTQNHLSGESAEVEYNGSNQYIDVISNGFKIRNATGQLNNSSAQYNIYCAWADSPFKYANAF